MREEINVDIDAGLIAMQASTQQRGPATLARIATAVGNITTADASDLATAIALANEAKVKMNALLAALRASGQLTT